MTSFGNDALIPTSLFITSPAMRLTYDFCGAIPTPGTHVMGDPCMASDYGDFAENFYRRNPVAAFPVAFTGGCPKPEQTRMGNAMSFRRSASRICGVIGPLLVAASFVVVSIAAGPAQAQRESPSRQMPQQRAAPQAQP